jgi:hypothetical protein
MNTTRPSCTSSGVRFQSETALQQNDPSVASSATTAGDVAVLWEHEPVAAVVNAAADVGADVLVPVGSLVAPPTATVLSVVAVTSPAPPQDASSRIAVESHGP